MSTRKLTRAIQQLLKEVNKTSKSLSKGIVLWLLRSLLVIGRQPLLAKSGFVLPTTILLLLVLTLTVGSIGYRTYTRTIETVGDRQQRVIYNAATPAIDRAKSKLEYLFDSQKDPRFPGGIPSEGQLLGMLYNDGRTITPSNISVPIYQPEGYDPYTLNDETRVSANGDATTDNAWRFRSDTNGDGTPDATVVYSIIFSTPTSLAQLQTASDAAVQTRANSLLVRHGPLSNSGQANAACQVASTAAAPPVEQGWFRDNTNSSLLRKNFQVNAYVLPDNANGTATTIEFHQDRQVARGNKWGAWFRNDLEIFPGPVFNWNGAMHTEGNLIVGASNGFTGFMISAPSSCLYTKDASEITVTNVVADAANEIPAFEGQFISGRTNNNAFANDPVRFHLFNGLGVPPIRAGAPINYNSTTDSVVNGGGGPADYALDPVRLQTEDVSVARNVVNPSANRDGAWSGRDFVGKERMVNRQQPAPYVDDSYRADNRTGPRPRYAGDAIPGKIGEPLVDNINDEPLAGQDDTSVGLDGYWERRARREGARIIVGQRLELGDPMGWGGSRAGASLVNEPLRPWQRCTTNNGGRCTEARQRRTLWDNLAAVQSAAIYHSAAGPANRDAPIACLALTTHPGTATTLAQSATFENLIYPGLPGFGAVPYQIDGYPDYPQTDFLRGRGTNGWEFTPPDESVFRTPGSPTMVALRNLATFAGDPLGGAPSFTPAQDRNVHPYPSMAMWGDFSILRRVLDLAQTDGYDALSPADKTTLHTAACTLGMLAYNIDYLENFDPLSTNTLYRADPDRLIGYENIPASDPNYYVGLRGKLRKLRSTTVPPLTADDPPPEFFSRIIAERGTVPYLTGQAVDNPEVFVRFLEQWRDWMVQNGKPFDKIDELNAQIRLAQMIISKEQVARDRRYGFFGFEGSNSAYGRAPLGRCELWHFGDSTAPPPYTATASDNSEPLRLLCSTRPRYPILYSLFPGKDDVAPLATQPANPFVPDYAGFEAHDEESGSNLTRDSEDNVDAYIALQNSGAIYNVVDPATVRLLPRPRGSWVLFNETASQPSSSFVNPANNRDTLIKVCTTPCLPNTSGSFPNTPTPAAYQATNPLFVRVPFKDSALFNGREAMSVRVLDMNLELMRRAPYNNDFLLPRSGIIYAFREDAVSEMEIVRPTGGAWNVCRNDTQLQTNASCRMNVGSVRATASTDPPVSSDNAISPKPVDYYPDPDRRPNGFRLRNGSRLGRTGDQGRGLSLISDNPVYLQGNFNLHQTSGGSPLEEFTQPLEPGFGNFYTRNTLDGSFSRPTSDDWRPAEILADAVSILSDDFCDGSIEDGFDPTALTSGNITTIKRSEYGCTSSHTRTSYLNQNRPLTAPPPNTNGVSWLRSNFADTFSVDGLTVTPRIPRTEGYSPYVVNRDSNPLRMTGPNTAADYNGQFVAMSSVKPLMPGLANTRVNSIIVSGIVPSRPNQSYGGLHNFPRFLENWGGQPLYIGGSFLQLSFSNHGTAPFDQDAFEIGATAIATESIRYYSPPDRRWGYDVGLQYAPAGPIAQRFVTTKSIRDEFYTEPPANDPYIRNLCLAAGGNCPP